MFSAVLFDVDGTLVDSNDAHAHAWVKAFAEAGIDADFDRVRRAIGMGGDKLMPAVSGIEEDSPEGQRISKRRGEIFKSAYLPALRPSGPLGPTRLELDKGGHLLAVLSGSGQRGDDRVVFRCSI